MYLLYTSFPALRLSKPFDIFVKFIFLLLGTGTIARQ